jgi:hypothetical protein
MSTRAQAFLPRFLPPLLHPVPRVSASPSCFHYLPLGSTTCLPARSTRMVHSLLAVWEPWTAHKSASTSSFGLQSAQATHRSDRPFHRESPFTGTMMTTSSSSLPVGVFVWCVKHVMPKRKQKSKKGVCGGKSVCLIGWWLTHV